MNRLAVCMRISATVELTHATKATPTRASHCIATSPVHKDMLASRAFRVHEIFDLMTEPVDSCAIVECFTIQIGGEQHVALLLGEHHHKPHQQQPSVLGELQQSCRFPLQARKKRLKTRLGD